MICLPSHMICIFTHDLYLHTWSVSSHMICIFTHDLYLQTWSVSSHMICICLHTWSVSSHMICIFTHNLYLHTWSVSFILQDAPPSDVKICFNSLNYRFAHITLVLEASSDPPTALYVGQISFTLSRFLDLGEKDQKRKSMFVHM